MKECTIARVTEGILLNYGWMLPPTLRNEISKKPPVALGAISNEGELLGCAVFRPSGRGMELAWIFVDAAYRGLGLATAMINRMKEVLGSDGRFLALYANYRETSFPAVKPLLEKCGFYLHNQDWPVYSFTLKEVLKAKRPSFDRIEGEVCSLNDCPKELLNEFAEAFIEARSKDSSYSGTMPHRFQDYDGGLSLVLIKKGRIVAATLYKERGDEYELFFAWKQEWESMVEPLFTESAYRIFETLFDDDIRLVAVTLTYEEEAMIKGIIEDTTPLQVVGAEWYALILDEATPELFGRHMLKRMPGPDLSKEPTQSRISFKNQKEQEAYRRDEQKDFRQSYNYWLHLSRMVLQDTRKKLEIGEEWLSKTEETAAIIADLNHYSNKPIPEVETKDLDELFATPWDFEFVFKTDCLASFDVRSISDKLTRQTLLVEKLEQSSSAEEFEGKLQRLKADSNELAKTFRTLMLANGVKKSSQGYEPLIKLPDSLADEQLRESMIYANSIYSQVLEDYRNYAKSFY
ncbi:MAG: GNAT family N-acetyltransferase [Pseudobutyrivibrio sp.]|nr:GNAT family N-acetyltransferase [Pseudobutyrivibrio sp.]